MQEPAQPAAIIAAAPPARALSVRRSRRVALALAPLPLFLALAVLYTWPLAPHLGAALPAATLPDALLQAQRLWLVPRLLAAGQGPYAWTDLIRFPGGASQYLETLIPLVGALAWPALALGGPLLAYGAATLLLLAADGWAAALLVRDRGAGWPGALAGGIAYAFSPYLLAHLRAGHLNLVAAFWPPLVLLCLLRTLERGSWRWAVGAGICLAGTLYTDLQWSLDLALIAVALVGWRALAAVWGRASGPMGGGRAGDKPPRYGREGGGVGAACVSSPLPSVGAGLVPGCGRRGRHAEVRSREHDTRGAAVVDKGPAGSGAGARLRAVLRPLLLGGLAALVALLLAAPLLLGIWSVSDEVKAPGANQAVRNSAVLLAFVAPQPAQPLWSGAVADWYAARGLDHGDEQTVSLGYMALALAAIGLAGRRTRHLGWLVGVLAFVALALGPQLHLGRWGESSDMPFDMPLPFSLLGHLPLVGLGRTPARFAAPVTLCLALLAGFGVSALGQRFGGRGRAVATLAIILLALEYLAAPFPLGSPTVPGPYRALAAGPCPGPIFEIPIEPGSEAEKQRLYFQTQHGCPISGGYVSRDQVETEIQRVWQKSAADAVGDPRAAAALAGRLRGAGFAAVVLWRDAYDSDRERERDERALAALGGTVAYAGDDGTVVRLR